MAITRAKKEVHILASNTDVSPFLRELEEGYEVNHRYPNNVKPLQCPKCDGTLIKRSSKNGSKFLGCSNYAIGCNYTMPIHYCPKCDQGVLQLHNDKEYRCSNEKCGYTEKACMKCGERMVKRYVKYNRPFMGCSNFAKTGCNYTESL